MTDNPAWFQDFQHHVAEVVYQRHVDAGLTEFFTTNDLVRFPEGVPYNRERDYRIVDSRKDGWMIASEDHRDEPRFAMPVTYADAVRLGMTHSPNDPNEVIHVSAETKTDPSHPREGSNLLNPRGR